MNVQLNNPMHRFITYPFFKEALGSLKIKENIVMFAIIKNLT